MALIRVNHVSDATYRCLKARAALADLPLSEFLRREFDRVASHPTLPEMVERLRGRDAVIGEPVADDLAKERR